MDDGADKGVSDLRLREIIGKKGKCVLALFCTAFLVIFMWRALPAQAMDTSDDGTLPDVERLLAEVEQRVSKAFSKLDSEKAGEIFDFVKEKAKNGGLKTEDGLKAAIEEAEEKFGVTVDRDVAGQVVAVMEKLENIGFSGEEIVDKARGLYDTYGADFVSHANEAFTQAVEETVENAVERFFENLWSGIKTSVRNFFENL